MFTEKVDENVWYPAVDATTAWREGWGYLFRLRLIFGATIVEFAAMLVTIYTGQPWYVSAAVVAVAILSVVTLLVVRTTRLRQIVVGQAFHHFFHNLRDDVLKIVASALSGDDAARAQYPHLFKRFHSDSAERIAQYFRGLTGDQTIGSCIRLAAGTGDSRRYITVGRSAKLNPNRQQSSQPLSFDDGISRMFRKKDKVGVCIFRNLAKAIADEAWKEQPNDRLPDIKTVMIAPINGHIDGQKSMLGLLYVSSSGNPFLQLHIEPLMAFADTLGLVYPIITGQRR